MSSKIYLVALLLVVMIPVFAVDDVSVNLDGNTNGHVFVVKDNAPTPATLFQVGGDGNAKLGAGKYLNFGATEGSPGYGFRDNAGVMEYKDASGSWKPWVAVPTSPYDFSGSAFSYGEIWYNHGNYSTTQPTVAIGASSAYASMFPCNLTGGTPYGTFASGDVSIATTGASLPTYLKINAPGTYRITATVAIQGTSNTSIEVEIFRQNSATVPLLSSWSTGTHDIESLSSALSVTNTQYDAGTITGIETFAANDYIALMSRVVSGSSSSQKVICINLNIQRIK